MNYEPQVHTTEALEKQIFSLQSSNFDSRIVGSLGRSVLFNKDLGNPLIEYSARHEMLLHDKHGRARDIDIINADKNTGDTPFAVDAMAFDNPDVRITKNGSDWWLHSDSKHFAEALDPAIMEPIEGVGANGITIRTLPAQTHLALTTARGELRRKDKISFNLLSSAIEHETDHLPNELYDPFKQLACLALPRALRLRQYAYRHMPESIEVALTPLLKKAHILPSEKNK